MIKLVLALGFQLSAFSFAASPAKLEVVGLDPAVELDAFAGAAPASYDREQRGHALLHLSGPPAVAERLPVPNAYVEQAGGRRAFESWRRSLRAAAGPAFDAYLSSTAAALEPDLARFRRAVEGADYVRRIEAYTGLVFEGAYRIAVSPHYPPGAMVNDVMTREDGTYEVASLFGGSRPASGPFNWALDDVPPAVWHELAHAVLDAAADLHGDAIARSAALRGAIPGGCYGEWRQCVKEHVVRAVYLRLMERHFGPAEAARALAQVDPAHFPYLKAMVARLEQYEKDRKRWPTLASFYPRLLEALPPVSGPADEPQAPLPEEASGLRWLVAQADGFPSRGQRARALRLLDGMLAAAPADRAGLLVRRAALKLLQDDASGAAAEFAAAAAACGARADEACAQARLYRDGPPAVPAAPAAPPAAAVVASTAEVPAGDPAALRREAVALYQKGDAAGALARLEAAHRSDPADAETEMDFGVVLQAAGRPAEAEAAYGRALAFFSSERLAGDRELAANTLSSRASLRHQGGDVEHARADLRAALEAAPPAWLRRVETEQQLKLWESGMRAVVPVTDIVLAPGGRWLVVMNVDGSADLWDLHAGRRLRRFHDLLQERDPAAFSPDGRSLLLWGSDFTGRLLDLDGLRELRVYRGLGTPVSSLAFLPDGLSFLSVGDDPQAWLWDVAAGTKTPVFVAHPGGLEDVSVSPDGRAALTVSQGVARLWDLAGGRLVRQVPGDWGWVSQAAFAPDGRSLASAYSNSEVRLWDAATGRQLQRFVGHLEASETVAFLGDGKTLVTGSLDATAALWDIATGERFRRFTGHTGAVREVVVVPGGRTLLTGSADGTVRLWDIASGRELCRLTADDAGETVLDPSGRPAPGLLAQVLSRR